MNVLRMTSELGRVAVLASLIPAAALADGAVYAMTNAIGNNQIIVWSRAVDGTLTPQQTIATSGGGSGTQLDPTDSLGSQSGIVLDKNHRRLFAVNTNTAAIDPVGGAGVHDCREGSISSFLVDKDGKLTLAATMSSAGLFPNSLTIHGDTLYVLNSGGPGLSPACGNAPNITGFHASGNGALAQIRNSTRFLNPGISPGSFLNCDPGGFPTPQFACGLNPPAFPRSPGQVAFTPSADALVVTVKATNSIYVFPLSEDDEDEGGGVPGAPAIWHASGPNQPTYFGFSFDRAGRLIVSEPFGATPVIPASPKSSVSSFSIGPNGSLTPISASVPNGRGTSCWVAVEPLNMRYAYTANNATSDISSYTIDRDGRLTLLAPVAGSAHNPNDMAVVTEKKVSFLYVLNAGNGTVGAFQINTDGSLAVIGSVTGLPTSAGSQGLAAY